MSEEEKELLIKILQSMVIEPEKGRDILYAINTLQKMFMAEDK